MKGLTLGILVIFIRHCVKIVFKFSQKISFDISCILSPVETICLRYQIIFSEKNKKMSLSSAEFAQRVIEVKLIFGN